MSEYCLTGDGETGDIRSGWTVWFALLFVILFAIYLRAQAIGLPLERDEGEFAYMARMILHGLAPYNHVYTMKLPGVAASYAIIMALFGQTAVGIKMGLMAVNAIAILLIFFLARRIFDPWSAVVAAASFAVLSAGPSVLGLAAHATQFVVLFVAGGLLLLLRALDSKSRLSFFMSGVLLGLAAIMKQPAFFFVLFAIVYLLWLNWNEKPTRLRRVWAQAGSIAAGATIPYAATCLVMAATGEFSSFWFWTFAYARRYATTASDELHISSFIANMAPYAPLVILVIAGIVMMVRSRGNRPRLVFILGFMIFSIMSILPGLCFRRHYFVLILPAVSILAGMATSLFANALSRRLSLPIAQKALSLFFVILLVIFGVFQQRGYHFKGNPDAASHALYGTNPFPESIEVAKYIQGHTSPDELFAVLGSEPQIAFLADRRLAGGYIYTYEMMKPHAFARRMQDEMIAEIEAARPRYIVFVDVESSWSFCDDSDRHLLEWSRGYLGRNYEQVGVVEIPPRGGARFYWDKDALARAPSEEANLIVYRRLGDDGGARDVDM